MKIQLIYLFFFISTCSFGQKVTKLEWVSKAKFDTIQYIGTRCVLKQECTDDEDSIIANGYALFSNAHIKSIGKCRNYRFFRDTVFYKAIIETENCDSLFQFFCNLNHHNYSESVLQKNIVYTSRFYTKENIVLQALFIVDKKRKTASLIIE